MSESIEHDFWQFHRENPEVYRRLVLLARALRDKGHGKLGIGMLFEVLRWQHMMQTHDPASDFKLNNNYRASYARLIMDSEADLEGIFETRRLHRDSTLEAGGRRAPEVIDETTFDTDDRLAAAVRAGAARRDEATYEQTGGRLL